MNKIFLFFIILVLLSSCVKKSISETYSSKEGPYFKFKKNGTFEFGIPADANPLRGNFSFENNSLILIANSIMLGNYATTSFRCSLIADTLFINELHITHPRFEIYINRLKNYAKTVRDTSVSEFNLNTAEAEQELFIYYKLVFDKFIKNEGG